MATSKGAGGRGKGAEGVGAKAEGTSDQLDVDGLFRLPLAEFTAARNALAARLKKAGRPSDADAVKALPKPSVLGASLSSKASYLAFGLS